MKSSYMRWLATEIPQKNGSFMVLKTLQFWDMEKQKWVDVPTVVEKFEIPAPCTHAATRQGEE